MFGLFDKGGLVMYFIVAVSVGGLTIILERIVYFYKIRINAQDFLEKIKGILGKNPGSKEVEAALEEAGNIKSPIGAVFSTIIQHRHMNAKAIEEEVQITARREIPKLEAFLSGLSTISTVSPLMGLLGTVIGMIISFSEMNKAVNGNLAQKVISGGIESALYTTAAGLIVAIPALVAHNIFNRKVELVVNEMEQYGTDLIVHLKGNDSL